ncbi:DUF1330 domain-containing protein [Azoarcus olearius]|uniref:DUF1330 domain-containing protein n=1 Tax=Azoarcus sp. (strain BH72) TaxID=418699 RepID=A1K1N9_AZOSB|nr:DUF1330 domain-containing protein [Azoarcus olearius]CAL92744.1 conserved hypothetical protein [Azoarcus olearius]
MKGYWIVRVDVADSERFMNYAQLAGPALKLYGARFLARVGPHTVVEGAARARNTVVEFPSYQAALDCWHSPEYQAARALRLGAAEVDIVVIEGFEGTQPGER